MYTCDPPSRALQTRACKRKTLVLDLDETLVHSTLDGQEGPDFSFPVFFNGCRPDFGCRRYRSVRVCARQLS